MESEGGGVELGWRKLRRRKFPEFLIIIIIHERVLIYNNLNMSLHFPPIPRLHWSDSADVHNNMSRVWGEGKEHDKDVRMDA